jgi:hypothetical protein
MATLSYTRLSAMGSLFDGTSVGFVVTLTPIFWGSLAKIIGEF